jgi:hypothetical protein
MVDGSSGTQEARMSTTDSPPETYKNVVHEAELDGGWSGQLRILVASSNSDEQLVFVDSDLLGPRRLVLTAQQALATAEALMSAGQFTLESEVAPAGVTAPIEA